MARIYEKGDHFVWFCDGTQSLLAAWLPYKDSVSGKSMVRFLLWPSNEQKMRYHLVQEEDIDPATGLIQQEYEESYVDLLELNPSKTRILVTLTFDGQPTKSSLKREDLVCEINHFEMINESLRAGNAALFEELQIERTMQHDAMKQKVDMIKEAIKVRSHVKEDSEGDDDMEDE